MFSGKTDGLDKMLDDVIYIHTYIHKLLLTCQSSSSQNSANRRHMLDHVILGTYFYDFISNNIVPFSNIDFLFIKG